MCAAVSGVRCERLQQVVAGVGTCSVGQVTRETLRTRGEARMAGTFRKRFHMKNANYFGVLNRQLDQLHITTHHSTNRGGSDSLQCHHPWFRSCNLLLTNEKKTNREMDFQEKTLNYNHN